MKFLHSGDLHLGRILNSYSLLEDQEYILRQILDIAQEREVDSILLSGDIYDKKNPSEEAVKLFDFFLNEISNKGLSLFAISGNHDSDERINFGSGIFDKNNIYISGKYEGNIKNYETEDEYGKIKVWLMPYIKQSFVEAEFPDKKIENYDDAVRCVLEECNVDMSQRNIILAHQFVMSDKKPMLDGSESRYASVGTIDFTHADNFSEFDYAALGHIHRPQNVHKNIIRYCGSPLKYSEREVNSNKSVTLITLKEKGNIEVETAELKPLRDMRKLKGDLSNLLKNAEDTDDYIIAELTDEEKRPEAMARLSEVYPNILSMTYEIDKINSDISLDYTDPSQEMGFEEILDEFYKFVFDKDMSEEERDILIETAKEAGVI